MCLTNAWEEHLNYHDHILETHDGEPQTAQHDLLIPVRRKTKQVPVQNAQVQPGLSLREILRDSIAVSPY